MSCTVDKKTIKQVIMFHGHNCPGLSIGIRVSELALHALRLVRGDDLLAVAETDMCAVDAVQFLTGCTLGKGNLIHRDYGKVAFSFFDKSGGRAVRITLKPDCLGPERDEMRSLMKKSGDQPLSSDEKERLSLLRKNQINTIMEKELSDIFDIKEINFSPPRSARIMDSRECAYCKEMTMESRVRLFEGKCFCIPCFETVDQKK